MLANRMIQAAAAASQANAKLYVDDVFSAYTYTGNGTTQTITNGIQLGESSIWVEYPTALPTISGRTYNGITYTNDRFIAVSSQQTNPWKSTAFAYSTDGVSWSAGTITSHAYTDVAYGAGVVVAIYADYDSGGDFYTSGAMYSSNNGSSWSAVSGLPTSDGNLYTIVYENGAFWVLAANTVYRSTNGMTFTSYGSTGVVAGTGIAYGNSTYILSHGSAYITSSDGITWSATTSLGAGAGDIVFGAGLFVIVGSGGVYTSTNGASWTLRLTTNLQSVTFDGTTFVAVGDKGWSSSDGVTWVERPLSVIHSLVCHGAGKVVAIYRAANITRVAYSASRTVVPGKGGMVWLKCRSTGYTPGHNLYDSARTNGRTHKLATDATDAENSDSGITMLSSGFSLTSGSVNYSGQTYIGWTFRKAAKFFDIVTYTGNGVAGRQIAHSLGVTPGMMIIKSTSLVESWQVYHRGAHATDPQSYPLYLNSTGATNGPDTFLNRIAPTDTYFTVGNITPINQNGQTYVAYIFAHDTGVDGLIQCGAFTTDAFGEATVNLGWEAQFVMTKTTATTSSWYITDVSRVMSEINCARLSAESSSAEGVVGGQWVIPRSTGFKVTAHQASQSYIYMAIRRPNKPPTLGTQVYKAIARTGTGAAATVTGVGFAPDLAVIGERTSSYAKGGPSWFDRLRGGPSFTAKVLYSPNTNAEAVPPGNAFESFMQDGVKYGADTSNQFLNYNTNETYIDLFFKRAPGVFDMICYTGTGSTNNVPHNLGVMPELILGKNRTTGSTNWVGGCYYGGVAHLSGLSLNATNAGSDNGITTANWQTFFTSTTVRTNTIYDYTAGQDANTSSANFVLYLFATKSGISKVGSYTGDGSTGKIINCDFTTTARFILIKRTDATGDWYVWDTTRGITNGSNDPHLSLNTTAAEVTTDNSIDPHSQGFMVNQVAATNINVNTATYIYLAIA